MTRPSLVVLVLTTLLSAGCIGPLGGQDEFEASESISDGEAKDWEEHIVLQDRRGPLALQVQLQAPEETRCDIRLIAQGIQPGEALPAYWRVNETHEGTIRFQNPEAHAGPVKASANEILIDPTWGLTVDLSFPVQGDHNITLVANELAAGAMGASEMGTDAALDLTLGCRAEVDRSFWATTTEVHSFTTNSFRDGVGADIFSLPVYTESHVNVMDRWGAETTAQRTLTTIREEPVVPEDMAATGTLVLTSPQATYTKEIDTAPLELRVTDGPGTYTVNLTRVAVAEQPLYGFIIGLEPVGEHLSDLPGWLDDQPDAR